MKCSKEGIKIDSERERESEKGTKTKPYML